jgi:hypothetical protein
VFIKREEFKSQEISLLLFSVHFNIEVDRVPAKFQMELLEMQDSDTLKHNSYGSTLPHFY